MRWSGTGSVSARAIAIGLAAWSIGTIGALLPTDPLIPRASAQGLFSPRKTDPDAVLNRTLSELVTIVRNRSVRVEGIGLVINLDRTGNDPAITSDRNMLLDRMRKAGVRDSDEILASKSTAMVVVRSGVPVGVSKHEPLDLSVELVNADASTSLRGGWLLETRLAETLVASGYAHEGKTVAIGGGPILIDPENPNVGWIPGGARALSEFPLWLRVKEGNRGYRSVRFIEEVVARRFKSERTDGRIRSGGAAEAKRDESLVLEVPSKYRQNQIRFGQVIKLLPLANSPEVMRRQLQKWGSELLDPTTAAVSALRLEALGRYSLPALQTGLQSSNAQVRYFSAEALAYLDDPSGAPILAEAVRNQPQFRAHALAALAASETPAATRQLQDLMSVPEPEVRFGAFEALRIQDPLNAYLGHVPLQSRTQISDTERRRRQALQGLAAYSMYTESEVASLLNLNGESPHNSRIASFSLHVVPSDGPPMVHVSTKKRREIVLFRSGQKLLRPAVLGGAGPILVNANIGNPIVQVSRIERSGDGQEDLRDEVPDDLIAVLQSLFKLGAGYQEVVGILVEASRQQNLEGPLVFDARPEPDEDYIRALVMGVDTTRSTDMELKTDRQVQPVGLFSSDRKGPFSFFRRWNPFARDDR